MTSASKPPGAKGNCDAEPLTKSFVDPKALEKLVELLEAKLGSSIIISLNPIISPSQPLRATSILVRGLDNCE